MEDERKRIGNRLRTIRRHLGITIQTVADLAGYSYTTICVWERGDRLPNLEALMSLCRIYKVTPNDVLMEAIDG